jgi:DNA invertase Pin-like site-specific DNA recombinase
LKIGYNRFVQTAAASLTSPRSLGAPQRRTNCARKLELTEHQKREAIRRRDRDGEPVREIARSYNVSHSTISRLAPD